MELRHEKEFTLCCYCNVTRMTIIIMIFIVLHSILALDNCNYGNFNRFFFYLDNYYFSSFIGVCNNCIICHLLEFLKRYQNHVREKET